MSFRLSFCVAIALPLFAADVVRVPVLVELFTSQGCSSCPAADEVLSRLASQQPFQNAEIIVLSEHVDYWNQLGWRDPYSDHQYTLRQQEYSTLFKQRGVYTPQMVINGRVELIGSDERLARREIQRATAVESNPANVHIEIKEINKKNVAIFALTVDHLPQLNENDVPQVWLAITESGIATPVQAGENSGRTLKHVGVVRTLVQATEMKRDASGYSALAKVTLQPSWNRKQLRAVLFVQEKNAKRVLGATSVPLE